MLTANFEKFEPLKKGGVSIMLTVPDANRDTLHALAEFYDRKVAINLNDEMPDVSSKLDTLRSIRAEVGRVMGLLDSAIGEGLKQELEDDGERAMEIREGAI